MHQRSSRERTTWLLASGRWAPWLRNLSPVRAAVPTVLYDTRRPAPPVGGAGWRAGQPLRHIARRGVVCFRGGVIVTCPLCFSSDDVSYERLPDRVVEYTCMNGHAGAGPHRWFASLDDTAYRGEAAEGVTDELLEPLSSCISPEDPWLEYGIVEYRFRQRFPELFAAHVRERGHRMFGDRVTASAVRFASALGRLAERGELVKKYRPATGAWAPQEVTYWARPPAPSSHLSWVDWCAEHGRPADWTDEDRALPKA